jgi:hypothetical protein
MANAKRPARCVPTADRGNEGGTCRTARLQPVCQGENLKRIAFRGEKQIDRLLGGKLLTNRKNLLKNGCNDFSDGAF